MEIMLSNIFEKFSCIDRKTNCYMSQMKTMLPNIFEKYIFFP